MATAACRRLSAWIIPVAVGFVAAYLLAVNASYWLWVANSAFRGIREPADPGLGVLSLILAAGPAVAGVLVFKSRRNRLGSIRAVTTAGGASLLATLTAMFVAVLLMGPF